MIENGEKQQNHKKLIIRKIQEILPFTFGYNVKQCKLLFTVGIPHCNCKFFIHKKQK
jgi:hypothetical protein